MGTVPWASATNTDGGSDAGRRQQTAIGSLPGTTLGLAIGPPLQAPKGLAAQSVVDLGAERERRVDNQVASPAAAFLHGQKQGGVDLPFDVDSHGHSPRGV